MNILLFASTFLATFGCGLMAGLFFAFSNFVMKALGTLPTAKGSVQCNRSISRFSILCFLAIFLGTAVACLVVIIFSLVYWHDSGSGWLLVGGLLCVVGTFLVTVIFNVPLNNALAAVNSESLNAAKVWADYLSRWTAWNHVRTISALVATASLTIALCQLRRPLA